MDWWLVVAGTLLVVAPFNYGRQMSRIRTSIVEGGGDVGGFENRMQRGWLPAVVWAFLPIGMLVLVFGLTSS